MIGGSVSQSEIPSTVLDTAPGPKGWSWAHDKQSGHDVYCTYVPRGSKTDQVTVLLHVDQDSNISISLALPNPWGETTSHWANEAKRSPVMKSVEGLMDTLKLSNCLEKSVKGKAKTFLREEEEEFLMKTANSLTGLFGMNKLPVEDEELTYDVNFRRAQHWEQIETGHHDEKPGDLIRLSESKGHYALPTKQAKRIYEKIKALE